MDPSSAQAEGDSRGLMERCAEEAVEPDIENEYDSECSDESEEDRMALTEDEHEWALRIKEIIHTDDELSAGPPLSDMMIAQIALVSMADAELEVEGAEDDMGEKVKDRIRGIQRVYETYEVVESLDSAKSLLTRWVQDLLPGFVLSFHPQEGSYVLVLDLTNMDQSVFCDMDVHLQAMKGMYYIYQCQNCDLAATRNGMISMCECEGYFWKSKRMVQVNVFREWAQLASGYPLNFRYIMHFHAGTFINLATSIAKRLVPPGVAKKFQFGTTPDQERLDRIYLQPSLEAANQRLLARLHEALELRFQNEATFTLSGTHAEHD